MSDSPTLHATAQRLVAPPKGILAADESLGTIEKRLKMIGLPSTVENRRAYRELLFTTPSIEEYLSGVILFDDTIRQSSSTGVPFPELLTEHGLLIGIKADKGTEPLHNSPTELQTKGLDGLANRLKDYRKLGATFTKWRSVFRLSNETPSQLAIEINARILAEFTHHAQMAGLMPIIEPEVLLDGRHSIARSAEATRHVLQKVFSALRDASVDLTGLVLKPNFITSGLEADDQASDDEVAKQTLAVFQSVVPSAVPGIVMISGGQSPVVATRRLHELAKCSVGLPWPISFSYGRALQREALERWQGKSENVPQAQAAFTHRLKLVAAARSGQYDPGMEQTH